MQKERIRPRIPAPASALNRSAFPLLVAVVLIFFAPVESSSRLRPSPSTTRRLEQQDVDASTLCPIGCREGGGDATARYRINPEGDKFTEVSYMAVSRQTTREGNAVAWVGSDGKQASISAVDLVTGDVVRTVELNVERKGDWEAMSLGPCTSLRNDPRMCMYVGNVGNNGAHDCRGRNCREGREEVRVYKFEEVDLTLPPPPEGGKVEVVEVSTLILNYNHPDLPTDRADCEAMFADFTGDEKDGSPGDLYLMTKFPSSKHLSRLTKVPAAVHENLKPAESVTFSVLPVGDPIEDTSWTGADMSLDGTLVAIRDYSYVYFYVRPPWLSVGEVLTGERCGFKSRTRIGGNARQFEAVAMIGGGGRTSVAEASECLGKGECEVGVNVCDLDFDDGASDFRARIFQQTAGNSPTGNLPPSSEPSVTPSSPPSSGPSVTPSSPPSSGPTTSTAPSGVPSVGPSTTPSAAPTSSLRPSSIPTVAPSDPPSDSPSAAPSPGPSVVPSTEPSPAPSSGPSAQPSSRPSASLEPTSSPLSVEPRLANNANAFAELSLDRSGADGRSSLANAALVVSCLAAMAIARW